MIPNAGRLINFIHKYKFYLNKGIFRQIIFIHYLLTIQNLRIFWISNIHLCKNDSFFSIFKTTYLQLLCKIRNYFLNFNFEKVLLLLVPVESLCWCGRLFSLTVKLAAFIILVSLIGRSAFITGLRRSS